MKQLGLIIAGAVLLGALQSGAAHALPLSMGPTCAICQGAIYSFSYNGTTFANSDPLGVGGAYSWILDVTVTNGVRFADWDAFTIKVRYVDGNGYQSGWGYPTRKVPEPSSLLLLGSGLLILGLVSRRYRFANI